jgi:hypothetical protein
MSLLHRADRRVGKGALLSLSKGARRVHRGFGRVGTLRSEIVEECPPY